MSEQLTQTIDQPAVEQPMIGQPEQNAGFMDSIRNTWFGRNAAKLAIAAACFGGGELALANAASADGAPVTAGELPSTVTLTIPGAENVDTAPGSGSATASDFANGRVTVLSYIRANGLPKKFIDKNRCFWADGGYNSGETINGPVHPTNANQVKWFYDPRETYVCHVPKSLSPTGLAKAGNKGPNGKLVDDCGNFWSSKPPEHVVQGRVELVRNAAKAKIRVSAQSAIEAVGRDSNGNVCGTAEASASARAFVSLREYVKTRGKTAVKLYGKLFARVRTGASVSVTCGPVEFVPPGTVPKDGTQGPGAGTPGQPGGPGAGGQPGNPSEGAPCYDDSSTVNGDLNPATSGDILYGTPDQFGNCVGPAQPMTSS